MTINHTIAKLLCKLCNMSDVCLHRRLTEQQKALILAYAETESGVDGTVSGIASTKNGKNATPDLCTRYTVVSIVVICYHLSASCTVMVVVRYGGYR